ncbi:MAG: glycosyltransferase [Deltaproteobacteria bacterium]|nr:MAG: glycosyltransferase [Deltaproteobacteria bacterium]
MKKVLIITYYYPPMQAAGSYRLVSFAKYLPKYGFDSVIIAPALNRRTWLGYQDPDMEINEQQVVRLPALHVGALARCMLGKRLSGYQKTITEFRSDNANILKKSLGYIYDELLTFPDPEWPWFLIGGPKALRVARQIRPSVILSSALPFTSHLIAAYISRRLKIPWVADYRDLWSQNHLRHRSKIPQQFSFSLEKRALRNCSAVTTVSYPLAQDLGNLFDIPVHVVTNGFDKDLYEGFDSSLTAGWKDYRMNIVYTGLIYPEKRDPSPLFQAIQLLHQEGAIKKGDLKIRFYGPNSDILQGIHSFQSVESFVELYGPIPHRQALSCQSHADLLLFLEWNDSTEKGVFTTKFFEYLGAGKPILAVGPPGGVVDQALAETGMGVLEADPRKLASILTCFMQSGSLQEDGVPHAVDPDHLNKYTREYQAGVLAEVLENVIKETESTCASS